MINRGSKNHCAVSRIIDDTCDPETSGQINILATRIFDYVRINYKDAAVGAELSIPAEAASPTRYISINSQAQEETITNASITKHDKVFSRVVGSFSKSINVTVADANDTIYNVDANIDIPFDLLLKLPAVGIFPYKIEVMSALAELDGNILPNNMLDLRADIVALVTVTAKIPLVVPYTRHLRANNWLDRSVITASMLDDFLFPSVNIDTDRD